MAEKAKCEVCNRNFPSSSALSMHRAAKHSNQEGVNTDKSGGKVFVYFLIFFFVALGIVYFINARSITGNVVNGPGNISGGEVQKITIGFKGNYYPNTIRVKEGVPVEITLDRSVGGCYRFFNIRSLGVSKYSTGPSETITFTPTQKGSFEFACGMRMRIGTIVVE